jgi:carbamoyl-phosphate synthase large subunit
VIKKIIILGSGSIKIGEAGEFDYSGTQALKALKDERIETILVNPNIATVQTEDKVADKIYLFPIFYNLIETIIIKEKPQGILLSFGGQTSINCGINLFKMGILGKYNIEVLGTPIESLIYSEDRYLFNHKMNDIEIKTARSITVTTINEALLAAYELGFPIIIRSGYALGGMGSGFANNQKELKFLSYKALSNYYSILIEEYLNGWKEIEYEVVRDQYDNCISVCNMENFDPIGIHTGDSIVVAPSQTLNNYEYQKLRNISINIAKIIKLIGECNVQFALSNNSGEYRVIEINARLSRSSALASKATGYPLAFIATKLSLNYGLYELINIINKKKSYLSEPSLDYIVCKIPRWDLTKFYHLHENVGSSMKSVGEIMAIGGSFEESFQKSIRMLDVLLEGFINIYIKTINYNLLYAQIIITTIRRIEAIEAAFNKNYTIEKLWCITKIDPWFITKLNNLHKTKLYFEKYSKFKKIPINLLILSKRKGFSDIQISRMIFDNNSTIYRYIMIRKYRNEKNIFPYIRKINYFAAEYPTQKKYLYISYNSIANDIIYDFKNKSIVVLGSGVYRIGSSVEFDWCCVNTLIKIRQLGYRSVMINCNPETVSTDFDECHSLFFEELNLEKILDIIEKENSKVTIVSMGGQITNNLALYIDKYVNSLLGNSALSIDGIEDRHNFSKALEYLNIKQPKFKELYDLNNTITFIKKVGYPILIRTYYVLSGSEMNIIFNYEKFIIYITKYVYINYPILVSSFFEKYQEIELDAISNKGKIIYYAIYEHIEFAGVHSGDATLIYPPQNICYSIIKKIESIAINIALYYNISGPFNIQLLLRNNDIQVIECNMRASRSFPFISKVSIVNLIQYSTAILLVNKFNINGPIPIFYNIQNIAIKASQFSFYKLDGADPVLGVDMSSTGEVGSFGKSFNDALIKSMLSVGDTITDHLVFISGYTSIFTSLMINVVNKLINNYYYILSNIFFFYILEYQNITSEYLCNYNILVHYEVNIYINNKKIDLIINLPSIKNQYDFIIRLIAINIKIPLLTNLILVYRFINSFTKYYLDKYIILDWPRFFYKK